MHQAKVKMCILNFIKSNKSRCTHYFLRFSKIKINKDIVSLLSTFGSCTFDWARVNICNGNFELSCKLSGNQLNIDYDILIKKDEISQYLLTIKMWA